MLDSPGGQLADQCTDKASSPSSGLQRCQSSAEHGYLHFYAEECIKLLRRRAPGPDASQVVRVSAPEGTEIHMHLELYLCVLMHTSHSAVS